MSSHAALGVVRAGVATLKGTGVRINCISPGQIDVGVSLQNFDMRGMSHQFPPPSLQSAETQKASIGLERSGLPTEVAKVAGFLASGFSSYMTGMFASPFMRPKMLTGMFRRKLGCRWRRKCDEPSGCSHISRFSRLHVDMTKMPPLPTTLPALL